MKPQSRRRYHIPLQSKLFFNRRDKASSRLRRKKRPAGTTPLWSVRYNRRRIGARRMIEQSRVMPDWVLFGRGSVWRTARTVNRLLMWRN